MSEVQEQRDSISTSNLRSLLLEVSPSLLSSKPLSRHHIDLLATLSYQLAESLGIHYSDDVSLSQSENQSEKALSDERLLTVSLLNLSLSYQNLYNSELKKLSTAFGIESVDNADTLINEISKTLAIDPSKNLSDQIVLKYSFPNDENSFNNNKSTFDLDSTSQISEASIFSNEANLSIASSALADAESKKDQKIAFYKKQISQLKEGITVFQKKAMRKLNRNNEKYEQKISELKAALQDEMDNKDSIIQENKALSIKIATLESNYEELESQFAGLQNLQNQLPNQPGTISNSSFTEHIMQSFNMLSTQYQNQLEEMKKEADNRKSLIKIINKYQEMIKIYEEEMNKAKTECSEHSILENEIIEFNIRPKGEDGNDDLFDSIADSLSTTSSPVVGDIVHVIHDSELTVDEKIKKIVDLLVDEINKLIRAVDSKNENSQKENQIIIQNLLNALHGQLNFIERLSNSDQDRQWLVSTNNSDDARRAIAQQAARLQLFLSEYAEGFTTDADLFDNIILSDDPQSISDRMQNFLTNFPAVRTPEGKELFAILRQSLAVCNILRRFSIESRSQCLIQAVELRSLRTELTGARADFEHRLEYETSAINQRLEEEIARSQTVENYINNIKNILMSSLMVNPTKQNTSSDQIIPENENPTYLITKTPAAVSDILDCIEQCENALDEVEHVGPVEYEQSLQRRLQSALEALEQRETELDGFKERAGLDVSSMTEELQSLKQEAQITIQKLNNELQGSKIQNNECLNEITTLTEQLEEMQNLNETLTEQLKQAKDDFTDNIDRKNTELEILKEKMDRRLTKAVMKIADKEKEKRKKLQTRMQDVRNENQRLLENLNEKVRENQILQEKFDLFKNESLNNDKRRIESNRTQNQNEIQLRKEIQSLKNEISELQINNKVLTEKVQKSEERYKNKIANIENVSSMRQESIKTEYETKIARMQQEMKEDRKDLLTMLFSKNFRGVMRVPSPVTEQDAQEMLQKAAKLIGPRASSSYSASVSASNSAFNSPLNSASNSPSKEKSSLAEDNNNGSQEQK